MRSQRIVLSVICLSELVSSVSLMGQASDKVFCHTAADMLNENPICTVLYQI
jgi:hypothetical protein